MVVASVRVHASCTDGTTTAASEDSEGRSDHLTGHVTEHASPAGEVRRSVGERHTAGIARTRIESERLVVGVTLGREVHLTDHRFEYRTESPSQP